MRLQLVLVRIGSKTGTHQFHRREGEIMFKRLKRLFGAKSEDLAELERVRQRCRRRFRQQYGYEMPDFEREIGANIRLIRRRYGIDIR